MYLLAYDISNNRRRTKLHKQLLNYGMPVQYSVFEIPELYLKDVKKVCASLLQEEDSVRLYRLCKRCSSATTLYGRNLPVINDESPPGVIEVPDISEVFEKKNRRGSTAPTLTKGDLELGRIQTTSRLMEMVCSMENLNEAFLDVKQNRGCAGSDGISIAAFDRKRTENLVLLQRELIENTYRPKLLKTFYIPKTEGDTRTLRVPSVRDRVAQQAVLRIITPVWEAEFEESSFAYRKGRSVIQAIRRVEDYREDGRFWVLRADVDDYFDEIPRQNLLERFTRKIKEDQIVSLVRQWIEIGSTSPSTKTTRGIPQGSSISPLLSNIYLDRFDEAIRRLGYKMVRYADDFLVACYSEKEACDALNDVRRELDHDGLRLSENKTRITSFTEGFIFLGYVFIGSFALKKSKIPSSWHVRGLPKGL